MLRESGYCTFTATRAPLYFSFALCTCITCVTCTQLEDADQALLRSGHHASSNVILFMLTDVAGPSLNSSVAAGPGITNILGVSGVWATLWGSRIKSHMIRQIGIVLLPDISPYVFCTHVPSVRWTDSDFLCLTQSCVLLTYMRGACMLYHTMYAISYDVCCNRRSCTNEVMPEQ